MREAFPGIIFSRKFLFIFLFYSLLFVPFTLSGQARVPGLTDFTIPDTVCAGQPVVATNLSTGTQTYFWSFCKADIQAVPQGMNLGNPNNTLVQPLYITLVRDGNDYYSFFTNQADGSITRFYHTGGLDQPPASAVNLSNFGGTLNMNLAGIQFVRDNGNWYGFAVDNDNFYRLEFGPSLQNNSPVVISLGIVVSTLKFNSLLILKEGTDYIGFYTNELTNTLARLTWGSNILSNPVLFDFVNLSGLDDPYQMAMFRQDTSWYMLICNAGDSTLSRIDFGSSLMNDDPTGINLGNVGSLDKNRGVSLLSECDDLTGFVLNHTTSGDRLVRLNFNGGITGTITGSPLGNTGMLDQPSIFSDWVRIGDTLFALATNTGNSTYSVFYFPDCTAATPSSSFLRDPPPFVYSTPGTYTVLLITDEGTAAEQDACRQITVMPPLTVSLGNDLSICTGQEATLDAGTGYTSYLWSTGETSRSITASVSGSYWVKVTNQWDCEASDTVNVTVLPVLTSTVDTMACYGTSYYAGGAWQTTAGTYVDTLQTPSGCDSVVTTYLSFKPEIPVDLGNNRYICPGETIVLSVSDSGATYEWQDGSTDTSFLVTEPGTYWVHVTKDQCIAGDTVIITECPSQLIFPNAFTPNEDGLNDVFRPKGISIGKFRMTIYNRWGMLLFETDDLEQGWNGIYKGEYCPAGVYSYTAVFEGTDEPGKQRRTSGSFTLVR